MRGAETFSVKTGDTLVDGDMVLTRAEGRVTLASGDTCSRELSGLQSLTVSADICEQMIASVNTSQPVSGGDLSPGTDPSQFALPALGVLAAVAVVAAAAPGDDEDPPTSP